MLLFQVECRPPTNLEDAIEKNQGDQPESSSSELSLPKKIENWLDSQGVTLELSVASKFKVALANNRMSAVFHGRIYRDRDPDTSLEKFREIDIVVRSTPLITPAMDLSLWLILECKSSDKYPWVFFRSSDLTDSAQKYEDAFLVKKNRQFNSSAIIGLRQSPIFNIAGVPFSTGGISAFSKEKSEVENESRNFVREAILQVLSATKGVSQDSNPVSEGIAASIFVPVIITKSPMFIVNLNEAGELQIESVVRELVVTRSRLNEYGRNSVWVIHENEIDKVVSEFTSSLSHISYNP